MTDLKMYYVDVEKSWHGTYCVLTTSKQRTRTHAMDAAAEDSRGDDDGSAIVQHISQPPTRDVHGMIVDDGLPYDISAFFNENDCPADMWKRLQAFKMRDWTFSLAQRCKHACVKQWHLVVPLQLSLVDAISLL